MFSTQFYNQTIKNTIVVFGNLFSNLRISRKNSAGVEIQQVAVPIAYSSKEKWMARINQNPDLNKSTMMTLPRMAFDMTTLRYDPERKLNSTNQFSNIVAGDTNRLNSLYAPVPYILSFELNVISKSNDDILQIIEQILPFFTPSFNVTVNSIPEMGILQDVPVTLHNVTSSDNYDADWSEERRIMYTLEFTAKINLYGPIKKQSIIKHVTTNIINDIDTSAPISEIYTAEVNPLEATKDEYYTIDEMWQELEGNVTPVTPL